MKKTDFTVFKTTWSNANAASANGKQLNNSELSYIFEVLGDYPLEDITRALITHSRRQKFAPTPSDVVEILRREVEARENLDNPFHQRFFGRSDERH